MCLICKADLCLYFLRLKAIHLLLNSKFIASDHHLICDYCSRVCWSCTKIFKIIFSHDMHYFLKCDALECWCLGNCIIIAQCCYYANTSCKHVHAINTPFTPLLYSETGGYKGIQIFLLLIQNIGCGYSIEWPW